MGKFEKKIRNRMNKEVEDFDVWFEKNQEKFPGFTSIPSEEIEQGNEITAKKKKVWLLPVGFLLAAVCVVLCFLPLMRQEQEPMFFGDELVSTNLLSEAEQEQVLKENPYLSQLTYTYGVKLLKNDDNSLVFVILHGELETIEDYYFVTVQIEHNPYYDFLSKPTYSELQQKTEINGYSIKYDLMGLDADELNVYRMLSEKNGQKIYWEIHCFEESIDQFICLMFNE